MSAAGCSCDGLPHVCEGLQAWGAGWSVVLLPHAEPGVTTETCRTCGRIGLFLLDHEDDPALLALPTSGACARCGGPIRDVWLGFEGADALRVDDTAVLPTVCMTCRTLVLPPHAPTGAVSANHAGWVHLRERPVELRTVEAGTALFVTEPEQLGPDEVPGLYLFPDWVSSNEQSALLACVDREPWRDDLKRRVQHHGWRYDYHRRTVDSDDHLGPLPAWSESVARRLVDDGHFTHPPDQLIVNEYVPGQGISAHTDASAFGPRVASLSLGSACEMVFRHGDRIVRYRLEPGTLVVLRGPARTTWTHAIPARKSDVRPDGTRTQRARRVSLTFRTLPGS